MTDPDGNLLVPLLFAKPGLATVPVMRLSLVAEGGGSPHHSIRRPFEVLDQTQLPANVSVLARVLPRYGRLDHYTGAYLFPPRGVDQFVDDFPEGHSHLLAVLLGFYALGADATLGGGAFREKMAGWTASTYPDKRGKLQPVTHLKQKLEAIFDENAELERLGCPRITDVLLSSQNRATVAACLGLPATGLQDPMDVSEHHLKACCDAAEVSSADPPNCIRVHFSNTFDEALERVFGPQLIARYKRSLALRKLVPGRTASIALAAIALAVLALWLILPGAVKGAQVAGDTSVQAMDGAGRVVWRREMGTKVKFAQLTEHTGGRRNVIVGLSGNGAGAGDVVSFDRGGREIWRLRPVDTSPYTGTRRLNFRVHSMLIADVLPRPGREIIVVYACTWSPCRVVILSEDGELLREMWHPGVLEGPVRLAGTNRLVFWGCNNELRKPEQDATTRSAIYTRVVFCVEANKVAGQCPPHIGPGLPAADLLWYRVLTPWGSRFADAVRANPRLGPNEAVLEIRTTRGWFLYIDAEGDVIERSRGDVHEQPPCALIDIPAAVEE